MATRRSTPWLAASAVLLLSAASHAEQFEYGARSGLVWDSNVYGTPEDEGDDPVSDSSWRFSPFGEVSDPDGRLTWTLHYQPAYEYYLQESELSGFDQSGSGRLGWSFADRWSIQLSEHYAEFRSPVRFNQEAGDPVNLEVRTNEVTSNLTNAVLRHQLSRRDSLSLALDYRQIDYSSGEGNKRETPSAAFVYDHILSERTSAGATLTWIQQNFERQSGGETDTTEYYNLSGFVNHAFSRTLRLELAGGPTFIDSSPPTVFRPRQFGVRNNPELGLVGINANSCTPVGANLAALNYSNCGARTGVITEGAEIVTNLTKKVPTIDAQGRPLELSGSGETDLTYFARVALIKDWENWNASLAYERANSDTASFGSSAVADSLEATLRWKPRPLWTLYLSAGASLQEQTTEGVVPQQFVVLNAPAPPGVTVTDDTGALVNELAEVQSIIAESAENAQKSWLQSASFTATRQLTRHASAFASVFWYSQRSELDADIDQTTRWNNLTFYVGLEWKFDPIRF